MERVSLSLNRLEGGWSSLVSQTTGRGADHVPAVVGINCHLLNAILDSRSYQLRLSKQILAMISFSTHRSFPCLGKLTISSNCKNYKWNGSMKALTECFSLQCYHRSLLILICLTVAIELQSGGCYFGQSWSSSKVPFISPTENVRWLIAGAPLQLGLPSKSSDSIIKPLTMVLQSIYKFFLIKKSQQCKVVQIKLPGKKVNLNPYLHFHKNNWVLQILSGN